MSRSSSQVIPPVATAPAASTTAFHPILQAALENLDVQLEEELTRYRRQQRLQSHTLRRKSSFAGAKSPQSSADLQLPQFPVTPIAAPTSASPDLETAIAAASSMSSSTVIPAPSPAATAVAPPAVDPAGAEFMQEELTRAELTETELTAAELTTIDKTDKTQLAVLSTNGGNRSLQAPAAPSTVPDDYFASSEELLRSIAEEEPEERTVQPNLLDTLLTPLGIGSLLLLILSTATLGYLVMNPATLGFFSAQKQTPESAAVDPAQPAAPEAIVAPAPDLAAKEFVDLNLNSLSTLPKPSPAAPSKPAASPSPQAATQPLDPLVPPATNLSPLPEVRVPAQPAVIAPAPAANPRPAAPAERSASYAPAPPPEPAPVSPAAARPAAPDPSSISDPAPRAESRTPAVAASSPASPRPNYLVVTPYRSDSELDQVQQAVPDAYVRNFSDGASVQMGAFSDEAKAQELIQELQQQGIQAEVRERE